MPIATPMSADLSAGASFTPSPVIATMSPVGLQRVDDPQLVLGRDARVDRHRRAPPRAKRVLVERLELGAA